MMLQWDDLSWAHIASTLLGGGGVTVIARWLFDRALLTLHEITAKLETVTHKLMVIETRLEDLKDVRPTVIEHERKLAVLEARLRPARYCKDDEG